MVFSLPHLPSLPSLRNMLDPEPQVLYPPSATNTPLPSPSAKARIKNLPPVPNDWTKEERGRRTSISSSSSSSRHGPSASTNHGFTPSASTNNLVRPTHRRAHSAMPLRAGPIHAQGRLTEYSLGNNPLASTSALSLPTLVEAEADTYIESGPSNHRRRGSRSSIHSNNSAMSSLPPSPRRPHASLPNPTSVPPPIPRTTSKRPVLSPRAWSVMDVRPIHEHELECGTSSSANTNVNTPARKGLTRHQSYTITRPVIAASTPARPRLAVVSERSMSSSQVSDVAVLASWHFPDEASGASSPNTGEGGEGGGGKPGLKRTQSAMPSAGSSRDLADRLRSLADIDTSSTTISSQSPSSTTNTTPTTNLVPRPSAIAGFQPKLSHRYTHSSPNLNIYATPPGHRRGLRQPTPLGSNSNQVNNLASSPGSLSLSVSTSDTDSSIIEPTSPAGSLASQNQGGRWLDKARAWGRRGSSISVAPISLPGENERELEEVANGLKGLELHQREEEEDDCEDYIDFDRI